MPDLEVESCRRKWYVAACGCEARAYEAGCTKLSCATCESHLRSRRAAAIRDRIERVRGNRALVYTVLTVPPERREAAADVKTWNNWRSKVWRWMKKHAGGVFAVERTDPCGDKDKGLWHPHLNFLWIQRDGFTGFFNVEALKTEWRRIIGATRGVSVWTRYSADSRRIGHWYWYLARTWPRWAKSVKRHLTVRWMGDYPRAACGLEKVGDRQLACECVRARGCRRCGETYVHLRVPDKLAADQLVALGPAAVRFEYEQDEAARALAPLQKRIWQ